MVKAMKFIVGVWHRLCAFFLHLCSSIFPLKTLLSGHIVNLGSRHCFIVPSLFCELVSFSWIFHPFFVINRHALPDFFFSVILQFIHSSRHTNQLKLTCNVEAFWKMKKQLRIIGSVQYYKTFDLYEDTHFAWRDTSSILCFIALSVAANLFSSVFKGVMFRSGMSWLSTPWYC